MYVMLRAMLLEFPQEHVDCVANDDNSIDDYSGICVFGCYCGFCAYVGVCGPAIDWSNTLVFALVQNEKYIYITSAHTEIIYSVCYWGYRIAFASGGFIDTRLALYSSNNNEHGCSISCSRLRNCVAIVCGHSTLSLSLSYSSGPKRQREIAII